MSGERMEIIRSFTWNANVSENNKHVWSNIKNTESKHTFGIIFWSVSRERERATLRNRFQTIQRSKQQPAIRSSTVFCGEKDEKFSFFGISQIVLHFSIFKKKIQYTWYSLVLSRITWFHHLSFSQNLLVSAGTKRYHPKQEWSLKL